MLNLLPLVALIALLKSAFAQDICWASNYRWGPSCVSSKSLYGNPNTFIDYYIESMSPGVSLYCYAWAMASYTRGAYCKMAWQYIGMIGGYGEAYRFIWGNYAGTPAIQCQGLPYGTYVRWSWSFGVSSYSCRTERQNQTISNISLSNETMPLNDTYVPIMVTSSDDS